MASISHLAAGALCGAVYARKTDSRPLPTMATFAFLGLASDLDFFGLEAGLSGTFLGHRAMTHSLTFSVVVGVLLGVSIPKPKHRRIASLLCTLALASHAILDAMAQSEPGPELFWPFSSAHVVAFWRPIPAVQFYQDYFTSAAIPVFIGEALWCIPFIAAIGWVLLRPRGEVSTGAAEALALEND